MGQGEDGEGIPIREDKMKKRSTQYAVRSTTQDENILIAGSGGQGIVFLASLIARAAVEEGRHVTFIRSYGSEMRGGTAHCLVRLSAQEIASPVFKKATIAIIMNKPSLERFKNRLDKKGLLMVNAEGKLDLNKKALKLGSIKTANAIALGLALRKKPFVNRRSVEKVLKDGLKEKKDLLRINLKALDLGYKNG
jgi:2-oxoglutarate ferredoxin oxidoreductase subunit gamma